MHLIISEGRGSISYRGTTLRSGPPAIRVVPMDEIANVGREVQVKPLVGDPLATNKPSR